MIKTIRIGNSSYDLKSSAFTMFAYKDQMGRDLLQDIKYLNNKYMEISKLEKEDQESEWLNEMGGIIEKTLKLAYIMIKEQNSNFMSYEDWLKELDCLLTDNTWIMEVLEMGISPFLGRIQNS